MVTIKACFITNAGKAREDNEDSILIDDLMISRTSMREPGCRESGGEGIFFVVADGMGGHARGGAASGVVLDEFRNQAAGRVAAEDILKIIKKAKHKLNEMARADKEAVGLGTTVAGIFLDGVKATVFNCGDSRVYRLKGRHLERISRDHSLVQELAAYGIIAERDMRHHPHKNVITSAISGDFKDDPPAVFFRDIEMEGREIFLLCTDGLWESMDTRHMEECFSGADPEAAVTCLFSKAMDTHARDNLSIIVLEAAVSH